MFTTVLLLAFDGRALLLPEKARVPALIVLAPV